MPVRQLNNPANPNVFRLRGLLENEWRAPNELAEQPLILEEQSGRYNLSRHLYVIWDEWNLLSQTERSAVIMDAYEATHSLEDLLSVTVAMGLTVGEADRMGISH